MIGNILKNFFKAFKVLIYYIKEYFLAQKRELLPCLQI